MADNSRLVIHFFYPRFQRIGFACKNQTIFVKRVATEHTANRIGNERTNISAKVSLADSNILVLNFRCQLIPQAVNVDEDTIQFFLIIFQLIKAFITFGLPLVKGFRNDRNAAKQRMMLEVP